MDRLNTNNSSNYPNIIKWIGWALFGGLVVLVVGVVGLAISMALQPPIAAFISNLIKFLLATNSVQVMWYITRAAGIVAYMLLWFSTVWGMALPTKLLDKVVQRASSFEFHQFISLLALGFIGLHVGVLMADRYLPYSLAQVFIPFLSPYRPVWVGIGVIGLYLTLLVTVTFYLRSRIGMKAFRSIHMLSLVAYLGGLVHGFFSGTDTPLAGMMLLYYSTFLVVLFLVAYWVVMGILNKYGKPEKPVKPVVDNNKRIQA